MCDGGVKLRTEVESTTALWLTARGTAIKAGPSHDQKQLFSQCKSLTQCRSNLRIYLQKGVRGCISEKQHVGFTFAADSRYWAALSTITIETVNVGQIRRA
jgi:hypothetical protein